jgi:hypothetical protein
MLSSEDVAGNVFKLPTPLRRYVAFVAALLDRGTSSKTWQTLVIAPGPSRRMVFYTIVRSAASDSARDFEKGKRTPGLESSLLHLQVSRAYEGAVGRKNHASA